MVRSTITFARGLIGSENTQLIEVGETLSSLQKNVVEPFSFEKDREVHIRVRPLAFRRALRNLIENALRYGGNARVNYEVQDQTLLVSIEDDGPGIPEVQLEQVFEPFFRLEESRSLETGGHGLGLSISRTIARSHGGDISLSNREGKGLVAQLRIPLSEDSLTPELKESAGNAGFVKTGC